MRLQSPILDGRSSERIVEQLKELAPYYVPDWSAGNERGTGAAVVQIFARLYADTLQRLNRVPEKNFIAFLNKMGVSLLPAVQARAPVQFRLSAGAKEPVLIPARTQTAASPSDGGKPVLFETETPILATPARIVELVSATEDGESLFQAPRGFIGRETSPFWAVLASPAGQGDSVLTVGNAKGLETGDLLLVDGSEHAEVVLAKGSRIELAAPLQESYPAHAEVSRVTDFTLFHGFNKQTCDLYLSHSGLFRFGTGACLSVLADNESSGNAVPSISWHWQYWDGTWTDFTIDGEGLLRTGEGVKELGICSINGQAGRWIRGRVAGRLEDGRMPGLWSLRVTNDGLPPDMLFSNDNPVRAEGEEPAAFYMFGSSPRLYDTFYIASAEAFSKRESEVTLTLVLAEAWDEETIVLALTQGVSWEYWNGGGWMRWPLTGAEYDDRTLRLYFRQAADPASVAVQGQENWWVRCRIVSATPSDGEGSPIEAADKRIALEGVAISYRSEARPELALLYRNLQYRNPAERQLPAGEAESPKQALYVGFDVPPLRGPVSLYFSLQEQAYAADSHPIVEWEYFAARRGGSVWTKLGAADGTNHLTRSGCLVFAGLPDWTDAELFGRSCYWLRAVDKLNRFQTHASPPAAPAPIIRGVYRNTAIVRQAESVKDELIGSSKGIANAEFSVSKLPVLSEELYVNEMSSISEGERASIMEGDSSGYIEEKTGQGVLSRFWVRWTPVGRLADSGADDRHYTIDRTFGTIRFGDGVHGKIPPIGADNIKLNYQAGGGSRGNVEADSITVLRSSIAYVDGVSNPEPASGGYDTENIAEAMTRGPTRFRHRGRCVTASDYESLAIEAVRGIAKVRCLPNVNDRGERETGWVTVLIVPNSSATLPQPGAEMKQRIAAYLAERSPILLAARVHIRGPAYMEVSVQTVMTASSPGEIPAVENETEFRLKSYLDPINGGSDRQGWAFGQYPALSDLYKLLFDIPGLHHIDSLSMEWKDLDTQQTFVVDGNAADGSRMFTPLHLLSGGTHRVTVKL